MIETVISEKYNGRDVHLFKLENDFISAGILDFGGILKYFNVKTPSGMKNIVLGVESIDEYLNENNYSSAIVGRVANRIKNATFVQNGKTYNITKNEGNHCNHGGKAGFDKKFYDYKIKDDVLTLSILSPDGDQGFAGNLKLDVEYRLDDNELCIKFMAKSDKDTVFAPTYHPYFNLSGEGNIYDTLLKINSQEYAVADKENITTGEMKSVKGTMFDFSDFTPIGKGLLSDEKEIKLAGGYDHCFSVKDEYMASAYDKKTGIMMDIFSNLKGLQLYTTNVPSGQGRFFKHSAFCLEPQFFPCALNIDNFEKPILPAGKPVEYYIKYALSIK